MVALIAVPPRAPNTTNPRASRRRVSEQLESRNPSEQPGTRHGTGRVAQGHAARGDVGDRAQEINEEGASDDGRPDPVTNQQHGRQGDPGRRPDGRDIPAGERNGKPDPSREEVREKDQPTLGKVPGPLPELRPRHIRSDVH